MVTGTPAPAAATELRIKWTDVHMQMDPLEVWCSRGHLRTQQDRSSVVPV